MIGISKGIFFKRFVAHRGHSDYIDVHNKFIYMKLIIFIILCMLLIHTVNAQEYGDIIIKNETIWKNQIRVHAGNIIVNNGGNLIIDNTKIIFNNTIYNNGILIAFDQSGGKLTIRNNSFIGVMNNSGNGSLNDKGQWTSINLDYHGKLDISDSTLERFRAVGGKGRYLMAGVSYYYPTADSYLDNVTFNKYGCSGFTSIIYGQEMRYKLSIKNSTFIPYQDKGNCTFDENHPTISWTGYPSASLVVENNYFHNTSTGVQINGGYNVRVYNNTMINPAVAYSFHTSTYNSYAGYNHITFTNSNYAYSTAGCNTGCRNVTFENDLIDGVSTPSKGGNHVNAGGVNVTMRNIVGINVYNGFYGSGSGTPNTLFKVYNNSITGGTQNYAAGFGMPITNSLVYDNRFYNNTGVTTPCLVSQKITNAYPINNTFTNNTCDNFAQGILLQDSTNIKFIDNKFLNIREQFVRFLGNNNNIIFINNNINSSKLYFSNTQDSFNNYYYADILVQDVNGNPISGATLTAENENHSSYTSIDRTGALKTKFTTGSDGHTKIPKVNDSETVVLLAYVQNKI